MVCTHKELKKYETVLRLLGPAGMSSDESSAENGVKQYVTMKKVWRHKDVGFLLQTLDALYRRDRLNALTNKRRGAQPRLRKTGTKTSSRTPPPPGLPITAFDPTWLEAQPDFDRELLSIQDKRFNFVPSKDIIM